MRAFFAGGIDKMHIPWAVEALPALLHLSLFLFFSGLIVFLLDINHSVFLPVVCWIGLFSTMYGWVTFMPMFRPDSPYYTPLSTPAAFILVFILTMLIAVVKFVIVTCIWVPMALSVWIVIRSRIRTSRRHKVVYGMNIEVPPNNVRGTRSLLLHHHKETWNRFMRFPGYMLYIADPIWRSIFYRAEGMWTIGKVAEEITVKRSWEIDVGILKWAIGALGEDDALEKFFEAVPGFLNSKLVNIYGTRMTIHRTLSIKLRDALNKFLRRTISSNTVIEAVKNRRLDIYLNAINEVFEHYQLLDTFHDLLRGEFGQLPQSIETAHTLARWRSAYSQDIARLVRFLVVNILQSIPKRDDRWVTLARDQLRLPERFLRENISLGDNNVLLSILIHIASQVVSTDRSDPEILSSLSRFDIRKTLPKLQTEFCTLWNQIVLEARSEQQSWHPHVDVLRSIRHLYIALHQGTDAAPTSFSASTADNAYILSLPSCYPLCNVATHHPNLTAISRPIQFDDPRPAAPRPSLPGNQPISSGSTAPQQEGRAKVFVGRASSAEYAPSHHQGSPSPSPIPNPTHIAPQINVVSDHTSQELIQTVALSLNPLVTMEVPRLSRRSPLSASDLTADIVRPDEPTPDMSTDEMRETSHTPAATLLTSSHHDNVPATVTPSTVPRPPFDSLEYSGDFSLTLQLDTSALTSSPPIDDTSQ
jgi:hypothetical protein